MLPSGTHFFQDNGKIKITGFRLDHAGMTNKQVCSTYKSIWHKEDTIENICEKYRTINSGMDYDLDAGGLFL
jgi:hypothetical protein